ncbi:plasmid pRiA4b ORF-3 family protein [Dactylosporangium matsuzakiense]|nr:plasmid pRiA4b ORF-3 family protein [Dactylosporangium matsuzakiense]UWZ45283.1 plasmid pRiA4b ORF-3 family protein [Dactylosporangium matsuzakiense]
MDAVNCTIMVRARLLAGWLGAGRPVTAKGVLRPADISAAAAAMGVETPPKARTAADVEVLHRPWVAAQAMGLIAVDAIRARATIGPAGDQLEAWWTSLLAVLRSESHDRRGEGAAVLCRTLLAVLEDEPPLDELEDRVDARLRVADLWQFGAVFEAFRRGVMPVDGGLEVLAEFGAVDAAARLTALGRWASRRFAAATPQPVTPDLLASELLCRLAPLSEQDALRQAQRWLAGRDIDEAVAAVFSAAEAGTPAARLAGIDLVGALGEAMRQAWQAALERPMLAPHARAVLATWDAVDDRWEPSEADRSWLAVEYALTVEDPEERYHLVQDFGGPAVVEASGHPGAPGLREALAAAGRPPQRVYQLKIVLSGVTPPVWRRLRVPGSIPLDVLHYSIQAAFDWDDDHLHTFEADRRRYSDPDTALDGYEDETDVRLAKAMPREGATMTYVYDLGDCWEHRLLFVVSPSRRRGDRSICRSL